MKLDLATVKIWTDGSDNFRVEWMTEHGPACTTGTGNRSGWRDRDLSVWWAYDIAPDGVEELVIEMLREPDCWKWPKQWIGWETAEEMQRAFESERYAAYEAATNAIWQREQAKKVKVVA